MPNEPEPPRWLDDPKHVTLIVRGVYGVCALLAIGGVFLIDTEHMHFTWETWPAFYGIYGFVGCVFLVVAAKQLRRVIMRDEDFYDRS